VLSDWGERVPGGYDGGTSNPAFWLSLFSSFASNGHKPSFVDEKRIGIILFMFFEKNLFFALIIGNVYSMSDIIFGIDFGTTNSALAVNIDSNVKVVDIDRFNTKGRTLKSVLYFDPEEKEFFVGQEAIDNYIENDAYGRFIQSIKAFLPDNSFHSTEIKGKYYKLDDLIAIILKKIKTEGEKHVGSTVDSVVLGRPVIFSEDKDKDAFAEERLKSAARKAGFKHIHMQYEPIAAALSYESSLSSGEEKIVLIGDFGGGTSDFTIMKVKGGRQLRGYDSRKNILSLNGVYIGGDTFDSHIMREKIAVYFGKDVTIKAFMDDYSVGFPKILIRKLCKWHLIPQLRLPKTLQSIHEMKLRADKPELLENLISLIEDNYGYMLFQAIEKNKIDLSSANESTIIFDGMKQRIEENVTRSEFEEIIDNDLQTIKKCVETTLADASLSAKDIDVVFLTGGSSYIVCINRYFQEIFGKEKIDQTNAFTSVSFGLGIEGSSLRSSLRS
jgi:hypothetical chaperone protein